MSDIIYVYRNGLRKYQDVFDEGICFYDTECDLNKAFVRVPGDKELYDLLGSLDPHETVYVINIPSKYMEVQKGEGTRKILPYPVLFERETTNESETVYDSYPVLVPSLIRFMYRGDFGCVPNPNYNPCYNPCGLKHTKDQLNSIKKNCVQEYDRFNNRNKLDDCVELYGIDTASRIWSDAIGYFTNGNLVEPFATQGELPYVEFQAKKKGKKKSLKPKKKNKHRNNYFEEEDE